MNGKGGMLPIISVGSHNSVDFQEGQKHKIKLDNIDSENESTEGAKQAKIRRLRVGERLNRNNVQSLPKGLGMVSPKQQLSRPSMNQSLNKGKVSSKQLAMDQLTDSTRSIRGISPYVRGHLLTASQEQGVANIFKLTDNQFLSTSRTNLGAGHSTAPNSVIDGTSKKNRTNRNQKPESEALNPHE